MPTTLFIYFIPWFKNNLRRNLRISIMRAQVLIRFWVHTSKKEFIIHNSSCIKIHNKMTTQKYGHLMSHPHQTCLVLDLELCMTFNNPTWAYYYFKGMSLSLLGKVVLTTKHLMNRLILQTLNIRLPQNVLTNYILIS